VRLLHTMLRVGDLERFKDFYINVLGMQLLRKHDFPETKFTLAFLGYGDEPTNTVLELTYNWDTDGYNMGDAYGHIAIGVDDVRAACDQIRSAGENIIREAGPMKDVSTVIAFVEDPDGYKIELLIDK